MILPREQINRYLRHIIMPEISGQGQKKIIESSILILSDKARDVSSLVYYLSASGVGHISCCFINTEGYEKLFENVRDLNPDCLIELVDLESLSGKNNCPSRKKFTLNIFLLNKYGCADILSQYLSLGLSSEFTPAILSIYDGWEGFIQFVENKEVFSEICSKIKEFYSAEEQSIDSKEEESVFITSLLGTIAVIESVKFILSIGSKLGEPLFIDLLSMEFHRDSSLSIPSFLSDKKQETYRENEKLMPAVKNLAESRVLIVGAGGLGSPAAMALAKAGVGTIGFVDYDKVEISNLNRQIMHSTSRIGMPKVESAEIFIKNINSEVNVVTYNMGLTKDNVMEIINDYDVVIDGVDNFPARYLLNDACFFADKPMIEAGAVRFIGLNMTVIPKKGACYRCIFPIMPDLSRSQTCSEVGVLGPVPGVMGYIQAAETAKLLLGRGKLLVNRIMYFDALDMDFEVISIEKANQCSLCGNEPSVTELEEYEFSCTNKK